MVRRVCTFAALVLIAGACSDAAPPPESAVQDLLDATRAHVIQDIALSEAGEPPLSAGTVNFLNGMNAALEGVHDAATAAAAMPEFELLANRLHDLLPERVQLELAPVQAGQAAALAELNSWHIFEGHLERLKANPQAAQQLREPFEEFVSFFEKRKTDG